MVKYRICWFSVFLVATLAVVTANDYRLPKSVAPELYELEIITNLGDDGNNFTFEGKVWITVMSLERTQNITLHSKQIEILEDQISVQKISPNTSVPVADTSSNTENDFFTITLKEKLEPNTKYRVYIPFQGVLSDSLAGYYKSSYKDPKTGKKKYLAVTQMEPISARKAIPCFDEPAMKAKFKVSLGRKKKYIGLSNMPLQKTEPMEGHEGWEWDRFEESVPMSTYLLAFIVCDFDKEIAPKYKSSNTTFGIWSRKEALHQTKIAAQEGPRALNFFERFFDIEYPLPKQDMIAIPDFNAGAMENWGLITYREALLLFDSDASSNLNRYGIASVIAHELAHQWFGNLVTMKWWSDLWLNEGFATYMSDLAVHDAHPQWNSIEEEAANNLLAVYRLDALKSSHPVSTPIANPKMINEIFDTISYKKGSYLIRMMSLFLGMETLRHGVSNYLLENKFNNAEQDDLWRALTAQGHQDKTLPKDLSVKDIMDSWTLQTGYPLVNVIRDYKNHSAKVTQKRFLSDRFVMEKGSPSCWILPLSYTTQKEKDFKNARPKHWTSCPLGTERITDLPDEDNWVIFNIQVAGLYRVKYDTNNWKLLSNQLNEDHKVIPTLNRVQLLADSMALAWVGEIDYMVAFDIYKYMKKENEFLPWKAALSSIGSIERLLKSSSTYETFKPYMRKLLTAIYTEIGSFQLKNNTEDRLDAVKHQALILRSACKYEVSNCVMEAKRLFEDWVNAEEDSKRNSEATNADVKIPKDMKSVVYSIGIKHGGEKEWTLLWKKYLSTNIAGDKSSILGSLADTREVWLLQRYLEWSINEESGIRKQDASYIFASVASTDVGFFVARNFFESNIENIYKYLASNSDRLTRYLSALAGKMSTQEDYDWMTAFTKKYSKEFEGAKQGVKQALETIAINIQWQNKHGQKIREVLQTYQQD